MSRRPLILALAIASALLSVTVASAAAGANFTGSASSTLPYPGSNLLSVTFTEVGAGTHPVSYKLEAAAEFMVGQCDGSYTVERFVVSTETATPIAPMRGRTFGQLETASSPGGSPGCPPPPWNEDGTIGPSVAIPSPVFLGWVDITVTSSTGRVLELPDITITPQP